MQDNETQMKLSPCQTSLWLFEQLGGSRANLVPLGIHLEGPLDVAALERALGDVVASHEALRTVFVLSAGMPLQLVRSAVPVVVERTLLERQPGESIESAIAGHDTWATMLAPFDLASSPLFRARLYQCGTRDHVLALVFHHLIFDGWSCALLMEELAERYNARKAGQPCDRPTPGRYADFAAWYDTYLASPRASASAAFWRQQLDGASPAGFHDLRRGSSPDDAASTIAEIGLGVELSGAVRSLARELGATPFAAMCAALSIVLQRHSGATDVVIGTPFALRPPQFEATLGCFIGALPIRLDLSKGDASFPALVGQARGVVRRSLAHAEAPFQNILHSARGSRPDVAAQVFDVMLNVLNFPKPRRTFDGLVARRVNLYVPVSRFGFTLYVECFRPELRLIAARRASTVSRDYAQNILSQLTELLRQAVARPETSIGDFVLSRAMPCGSLPDLRNEIAVPTQIPVPAAVLEWARRAPEAPAVREGEKTWSYSELANAAAAVALRLEESGLRAGETVAVGGQRSFGLIAAALGTLAAGGALLLLDPALPDLRLEQMLRLAKATRLVKVGHLDLPAVADPALERIEIAPDMAGAGAAPAAAPASARIDGDAAAYVFFTSGTTGVPKGVVGCHKGLSHFLSWQRQAFAVGPGDRIALLTGLSFDVVLRDIFLPLTSGATLVLPDEGAVAHGALDWLQRAGITVLHAVPTVARRWLGQRPAGAAGHTLRLTFFAGEPLDDQLVKAWRSATSPSCAVVNLYGPTETTLAKCYYVVPEEPMAGVQPVGIPLPETQAAALRDGQQLCASGEIGEIVIRTPFRSNGYLSGSLPSRTGFVVNHATGQASDLLYRTGDLGRLRPDGLIELLGRADGQVKVNGARVEPQEIAAVLRQYPRVEDAAVQYVSHDGFTGLVGYVVASGDAPDERALKSFLRERLPAYMVPTVLISLEEMPRTANGKLDMRRLPAPAADAGARRAAPASAPPQSAIELRLAEAWRAVLAIDAIGLDDNFFDLGGTSLLLVTLYPAVKRIVGPALTISDLYRHPTIRHLALLAGKERPSVRDLPLPTRRLDQARQQRQAAQRRLLRQVRTQEPAWRSEP